MNLELHKLHVLNKLLSVAVMLCLDPDCLLWPLGGTENAKHWLVLLVALKRGTKIIYKSPFSGIFQLWPILLEKRRSQSVEGLFCEVEWWGVEVAHAPTCNWTLQPGLHVSAEFLCFWLKSAGGGMCKLWVGSHQLASQSGSAQAAQVDMGGRGGKDWQPAQLQYNALAKLTEFA